MKYYVEIIESDFTVDSEGEVVRRIDCGQNERKAEKVEGGVNINLNHAKYHTRIIEE